MVLRWPRGVYGVGAKITRLVFLNRREPEKKKTISGTRLKRIFTSYIFFNDSFENNSPFNFFVEIQNEKCCDTYIFIYLLSVFLGEEFWVIFIETFFYFLASVLVDHAVSSSRHLDTTYRSTVWEMVQQT